MTWNAPPASPPGGSDTHVQFNDGGSFDGDSNLVWDKTNKCLASGGASPTGAYRVYLLSQDESFNTVLYCYAKQTTGSSYSLLGLAISVDVDSGATISTNALRSGSRGIDIKQVIGGTVYGRCYAAEIEIDLESGCNVTGAGNAGALNLIVTKDGTVAGSTYGINLTINDEIDYSIFILALNPIITLQNSTHEDTDNGRESQIDFKGEQSGGETSTLARIRVSHDGASDDQKGKLIFYTNDGNDGNSPTERLKIDSNGGIILSNVKSGATQIAAGAAANEIWKTNSHATLPDNVLMIGV